MSEYRSRALKLSCFLDQLLFQIQETRFEMYDQAEIPHLFEKENLSIENDLNILAETEEYIRQTGNNQLCYFLRNVIDEKTNKLYELQTIAFNKLEELREVLQNISQGSFETKLEEIIWNQVQRISSFLGA